MADGISALEAARIKAAAANAELAAELARKEEEEGNKRVAVPLVMPDGSIITEEVSLRAVKALINPINLRPQPVSPEGAAAPATPEKKGKMAWIKRHVLPRRA